MAGELWTLIAASLLSQWIARAPDVQRDERDAEIASRALASSCYVLLVLQLALVIWFSFMQGRGVPAVPPGMLVHLFVLSWMVTHVFYDLACIRAYADARLAA